MRVPYAPADPPNPSEETQAIYERIRERRKPRPLVPLDLALLHNPKIADGFNTLLGAIRTESSLDSGLMELAICYVAVLNSKCGRQLLSAPFGLGAIILISFRCRLRMDRACSVGLESGH